MCQPMSGHYVVLGILLGALTTVQTECVSLCLVFVSDG